MARRTSRTGLGREGEEEAAAFLLSLGYRVRERNVRFRTGEIDIVAVEGDYLVFVEVKTRRGERFGTAVEAITPAKQHQLVRLAALYLAGKGLESCRCRFDVVAVEPAPSGGWSCSVIRDAFASS